MTNGQQDTRMTGFDMQRDIQQTAIHEAGHAVAYARLFPDEPLRGLTIVPDLDENAAGYAEVPADLAFVGSDMEDTEVEAYFLRVATFCCAGYAATLAFGGDTAEAERGCESDFEDAGHRLEPAKARAIELMAEPANKTAVGLIAEELLKRKTLDPSLVSILVDVADGETDMEGYRQYLALAGLELDGDADGGS